MSCGVISHQTATCCAHTCTRCAMPSTSRSLANSCTPTTVRDTASHCLTDAPSQPASAIRLGNFLLRRADAAVARLLDHLGKPTDRARSAQRCDANAPGDLCGIHRAP